MSTLAALALLAGLVALSACIFTAMLFVFAAVTGWRALARRYPASAGPAGRTYRIDSTVLGAWGWNAPPLRATLDDGGILLRAVAPFGIAFRPVHLPWEAIREVRHREFLLFRVTQISYGTGSGAVIGFAASPFVADVEARLRARGKPVAGPSV